MHEINLCCWTVLNDLSEKWVMIQVCNTNHALATVGVQGHHLRHRVTRLVVMKMTSGDRIMDTISQIT